MRSIPKPEGNQFSASSVYKKCVDEVSNKTMRDAFNSSIVDIVNAANDYDTAGNNSTLVELLPNDGDKEKAFLNGLSKEHFIKLYSNQLVKKEIPRKEIYDQLKSRAPHGKCPFCGYCDVDQLDHYRNRSPGPY